MGKMIEVALVRIRREDFNGDDEAYEVSGGLWGVTYDVESAPLTRKDLFTFPDGPIRFAPNQAVEIGTDARFAMSTNEPEDTPGLLGHFIKFGGELRVEGFLPFGEIFQHLHTSDLVSGTPHKYRVRFGGHNTEWRCDFTAVYVHPL